MTISIHQPAYLPWMGYFDKIAQSDVFVFLDTVQYEKNSFINRNKIRTVDGTQWLTIPVIGKDHLSHTLKDTLIDNQQNWRIKHERSIVQWYSKCPDFDSKMPILRSELYRDDDFLADYCYNQLLFWLKQLGLDTKMVRSSTLQIAGSKSDLVLEICKTLSATTYVSGSLGRGYLVEEDFSSVGIQVIYQDYVQQTYKQRWDGFIPNISVVDYWMNT